MFEGTHVYRVAEGGDDLHRRSFLDTPRALAVRTREFARLTDAVASGAAALWSAGAEERDKPVVRRSPDRCIVQLGPVALTAAWLRSTLDSVAHGELLLIVWRGVIAAPGPYVPDRTTARCIPVRSATALWEEVFAAAGTDEASWLWRPADAQIGGLSSADLADRCVARLRQAHDGEGEVDR